MHIKLDDIELIKRIDEDGAVKEIRNVHNLSIFGRRHIVELHIPGSAGNVFQDMGRNPLRISFDGELVGPGAYRTLQDLRSKFELKKPVPFSSDATPIDDVNEVVIESLTVHLIGGFTTGSRYSLVLREHKSSSTGIEAGPGETEPPSQEESAKEDIAEKTRKISRGVRPGSR